MDEFDIIRRYFLDALMPDYVSTGPGDDCAVLSVPSDQSLCVSTDTLLVGVHFPFNAAPEIVANRAFGANLSDLAAMGAQPHAVTVALTLPDADTEWLEGFSNAARGCSKLHQCPVVGGNLTKGDLSVTLTVMGIVAKELALLRSSAEVGDDVYVSGYLGDAAGAVKELGNVDANVDLLRRYQVPEPRIMLGMALRGVASAAIDISDGFLSDLGHLTTSSRVGATISLDAVPLSKQLLTVFGRTAALQLALNGGDDYELCFTAEPGQRAQIETIGRELNLNLSRVGKLVRGEAVVDQDGQALLGTGYRHFS
jgi:thiamine-monophosphate kinase